MVKWWWAIRLQLLPSLILHACIYRFFCVKLLTTLLFLSYHTKGIHWTGINMIHVVCWACVFFNKPPACCILRVNHFWLWDAGTNKMICAINMTKPHISFSLWEIVNDNSEYWCLVSNNQRCIFGQPRCRMYRFHWLLVNANVIHPHVTTNLVKTLCHKSPSPFLPCFLFDLWEVC